MSERDGYEPGPRAGSPRLSPTPKAPPRHWEVRFWIADADAAAEKAAAMGGSMVAGPYDVPGFRQAVLADPQGAAFTVSQLMIASQGA
jgi:predicted enzyme related to lactoylglutathione lyase